MSIDNVIKIAPFLLLCLEDRLLLDRFSPQDRTKVNSKYVNKLWYGVGGSRVLQSTHRGHP